jgi:membrane protein implicated in regulation of membrane protease activity
MSVTEGLPSLGEAFDERAPLIGAPAFFGPPIIYLLGPWLLLVLLLIGPVVLIFTLMLAAAVGASLLVAGAIVIASPYLLIRHLHGQRVSDAKTRAPRHVLRKHRAGTGRLGSPQTKGMS